MTTLTAMEQTVAAFLFVDSCDNFCIEFEDATHTDMVASWSTSDLAEPCGIPTTQIRGVVSSMIQKGHVFMDETPEGDRGPCLTPKGFELQKKLAIAS